MKRKTLIFLILVLVNCSVHSQFSFKLQTGISYIEHLSTGITFNILEKHNISVLYGSNLFIDQRDFLNILLQYDYKLARLNFAGITPGLGAKGGYSVFSNKYYKWKLSEIIPFARFGYNLNDKLDIFLDIGVAISIEHSVERISYGEIGMYREYLPEIKVGMNYKL